MTNIITNYNYVNVTNVKVTTTTVKKTNIIKTNILSPRLKVDWGSVFNVIIFTVILAGGLFLLFKILRKRLNSSLKRHKNLTVDAWIKKYKKKQNNLKK
ncbi:MAG: hypothetical protein KKH98_02790 [Spirochaetes bacterium]|nr:hypothetical protein [Spirochaetota bacterium]